MTPVIKITQTCLKTLKTKFFLYNRVKRDQINIKRNFIRWYLRKIFKKRSFIKIDIKNRFFFKNQLFLTVFTKNNIIFDHNFLRPIE